MPTIEEMMKGARTLVGSCTNVQPGETVLIITDPGMTSIANTIAAAVREKKAEAVITIIEQRSRTPQSHRAGSRSDEGLQRDILPL